MDIRELLVQKVALDTGTPEEVVHLVIRHQFQEALLGMRREGEIEISGFGKFTVSPAKVKRSVAKHLEIQAAIHKLLPQAPAARVEGYQAKLDNLQTNLDFMKNHSHEF